jgi:hypothetical protein
MIPVLAVPCLRRDLVGRMLASVDEPVGLKLVIDNGAGVPDLDAWVVRLPANLGVGAAWNLALKLTPRAPWWAIVNDDVIFTQGDLGNLILAMRAPGPRIAVLDGFAAFGINAAALDRVGYFDENYIPAYCEDADMEYRCRLAGVTIVGVENRMVHERSSTIGLPEYRRQNARTYQANVDYHRRKWGGGLRGGENYPTPFNRGGGANEWTLDPARLRELGWETTMRMPEDGEQR